ncbi:MAG: hypothetical protein ACKV2V_19410 [Blastocatellia bacterium]
MISPRKLLWIDGLGGLVAGIAVLLASDWLSQWYRLPPGFMFLIGVANLAYGSYSLSLAARARRPKVLILLLVVANLTWTLLCLRWTVIFAGTASWLGLAHLVIEGLYVGGLGCLEWRWREQLRTA